MQKGPFRPSFHAVFLSVGLVCSGDEHRGSGEVCDGVDMTIGHGNWNGIGMAAILAFLGASAMLQRCSGNAAEMLRQCCRDAPAMLQGCYGGAIATTPQSTLLHCCSWAPSRAKMCI